LALIVCAKSSGVQATFFFYSFAFSPKVKLLFLLLLIYGRNWHNLWTLEKNERKNSTARIMPICIDALKCLLCLQRFVIYLPIFFHLSGGSCGHFKA